MLEENALVISVEGEAHKLATVRSDRQSTCGSCSLKQGCGQSTLAKLSGGKCIELTVPNVLQAMPGDIVKLNVADQSLLTASLLIYMLPLVMMIVFSVLAEKFLVWPDSGVALTGLLALAAGFYLARLISMRYVVAERFLPQMVSISVKKSDSL